jgi:hypothetical protein
MQGDVGSGTEPVFLRIEGDASRQVTALEIVELWKSRRFQWHGEASALASFPPPGLRDFQSFADGRPDVRQAMVSAAQSKHPPVLLLVAGVLGVAVIISAVAVAQYVSR